jgi:hypothetical protein
MSCFDLTDTASAARHAAIDALNQALGAVGGIHSVPSGPWCAPTLGAALGSVRAGQAYAVLAQGDYVQAQVCFVSNGGVHQGVDEAIGTIAAALSHISAADSLVATCLGLCFVFVPTQPQLIAAMAELVAARDLLASIPQFVELEPVPAPARSADATRAPIRIDVPVPKPFPASPWRMVDGKPLTRRGAPIGMK